MGFREVSVIEVREVLRAWLGGAGTRTAGARAGVDRKTARRYVEAAQAAGLERSAGFDAVDDALVGQVVGAVRPVRPNGHGQAWEALLAHEQQIRDWVSGEGVERPLTVTKIGELLARRGCRVPYRTLHRFATERCGYRPKETTVPLVDGEPWGGVPGRLRPSGVAGRSRYRAAAQGARVDLHRGGVTAHVRLVDLRADVGGGDRRL